jgi:hypothetical protein
MEEYKVLINLMPNLGNLIILFECWAQIVGPFMDGGLDLREKSSWLRNVKFLRDSIREKITLLLRFDSLDTWVQRHPWQSGLLKPTSSEVIECLTRNQFVLYPPNADISEVTAPFDMIRKQDHISTLTPSFRKKTFRRSDIKLSMEYGK